MKTAAEVLERITDLIDEQFGEVGERTIKAMAGFGDADLYHEARRQATAYEAVRDLRDKLEQEIEVEPPKPRRRRRKAG